MATDNNESQPLDESEKAIETAKTEPTVNTEGEGTSKEPDNSQADANEETSNDDASYWKKMSRKNERDAKNAVKKLEERDAENGELRMKVARMELREKHPEFTDELIADLCPADTPEGLTAWAEKYLKYKQPTNTEDGTASKEEKPKRELSAGEKLVNQAADAAHGGGTWVGSKRSEADGRKLAQKIMEAKRPHRHGSK